MIPKWLLPASVTVMILGMLLVGLGPIAVYGFARWSATSEMAPEERRNEDAVNKAIEVKLAPRRSTIAVMVPLGFAMAFGGAIATIMAWLKLPEFQPPPDAGDPQGETPPEGSRSD